MSELERIGQEATVNFSHPQNLGSLEGFFLCFSREEPYNFTWRITDGARTAGDPVKVERDGLSLTGWVEHRTYGRSKFKVHSGSDVEGGDPSMFYAFAFEPRADLEEMGERELRFQPSGNEKRIWGAVRAGIESYLGGPPEND